MEKRMAQNKFSLDELVVAMQPIFDEYSDLRIENGIDFAQAFTVDFIKKTMNKSISQLPISQKVFADRIGVSKQYITALKSGRIIPSLEMFFVILFEIYLVLPREKSSR